MPLQGKNKKNKNTQLSMSHLNTQPQSQDNNGAESEWETDESLEAIETPSINERDASESETRRQLRYQ